MNWYTEVLKKYATFEGRASRSEYWYFFLFSGLLQLVFIGLAFVMPILAPAVNILIIIYAFAVMLPSLAVGVRRLHDIGKSGWWYLIILIPIIGAIVLFIFAVLDSVPGSNIYGSNPKNIQSAANHYPENKTEEYIPPQGIRGNVDMTQTITQKKLTPENSLYPPVNIQDGREMILGRNGDVVINNEYISGQHLKVFARSSICYVVDLDSTNGTYIEGRKLNPHEQVVIQEGQRIILGSEEVVYALQQV